MAKKDDDSSKGKGDGSSKRENKEGSKEKGKLKKGKSKGQDEDKQLKAVFKGQGPAPVYITIFLTLIKIWLFIYDCLNYIPYAIFNSPAEKLRKSKRQKAAPTSEGDNASPWRNVDNEDGKLLTEVFPGCDTIDKMWDKIVEKYSESPCLGTREIIKVHKEKLENGRVFEKLEQGEYLWESYEEVNERSIAVASGLLDIGHKRGTNLVIFADTRSEWLITALGCFRSGIPVVTVYATLGEEAIQHAINETEATTIVTTAELIPKVQSIVSKCGTLKRAIYFLPQNPEADEPDLGKLRDQCEHVLSLDDLEERGEENPSDFESPKASDVALIMYTSGTTGMPKGVMITHANVVAATAGQSSGVSILNEKDRYIGYLPLAHILEVDAELTVLAHGCRIGYSSPLTLHDRGSKVKRGTRGDCYALQPTVLAAVPAIMDRIFKAVSEEVAASPRIMQEFFRLNYERKRNRLEDGYESPFLDRVVFKRIRNLLGGKLRGVLSGGAPLNGETQRFMNICFCCPVIQGYGLTETTGAGAVASMDDLTTGTVGPPVRCCDIMLRDWKEAGYSPENDPPQGEILIGGPNVAAGYYKNKEKTNEDFVTVKGRRWFATGDIGEFRADGSLSIIDRKKDLVKLSHGEYISLARIETVLLTSNLVDNVCCYGNSEHSFLVAFVVPNEKNVKKLAEGQDVNTSDWEEVCADEEVTKSVLKELTNHATKNGLNKAEVPAKIHLCSEPWTPDSGLLTEALKLKRRPIAEKYEEELNKMYDGED